MFCVDASVFVSAARQQEVHSEKSERFFKKVVDEKSQIFLPEIVISEVASALMRATHDKESTNAFISALRNVPNFVFTPVDRNLADRSVEIILKTELRGADALYVALAVSYGIPLITLDKEQLSKGKKIAEVREP